MADVQIDGGKFFRLANALSEALARAACTGSEHRVIHAIMRETYGRRRTKSRLSAARIGSITGLRRRRVSDILRQLEARKMILVEREVERTAAVIGLQKDFDQWESASTLGRVTDPADKPSKPPETDPADGPYDPADGPSNPVTSDPADCASDPADGPETDPADAAQQRQKTEPKTSRRRQPNLKPPDLETYAEKIYDLTKVRALSGFCPVSQDVVDGCCSKRPGTHPESVVRYYAHKLPDMLNRGTLPENFGRTVSTWFRLACEGKSRESIDSELAAAARWVTDWEQYEARLERLADGAADLIKAEQEAQRSRKEARASPRLTDAELLREIFPLTP